MADDLPHYKAFILRQECAVVPDIAPCVLPAEPHHHTRAPTHPPWVPPPKGVGGMRGKSQRASDYYLLPLCLVHHNDLHDATGPFRDWDKEQRRAWQDEQVQRFRGLYEAELERTGEVVPEETNWKPAEKRPSRLRRRRPVDRGRADSAPADAITAAVIAERNSIVDAVQELAAEARHKPGEHAVLIDVIDIIKARGIGRAPKTRCVVCSKRSGELVQGICPNCRESAEEAMSSI
jgi:hypothetical protein